MNLPAMVMLYLFSRTGKGGILSPAPASRTHARSVKHHAIDRRPARHHKGKAPKWPDRKHPPPPHPTDPASSLVHAPKVRMPTMPRPTPMAHERPAPRHHYARHHSAPHPRDQDASPSEDLHDVHEAPPEPTPAESTIVPGEMSVASVQSVLRGLGWTGGTRDQSGWHGRTVTSTNSELLSDGEFGPLTVDCWERSATKRNLDPVIERVGPNTARVDPDTYAALRSVARQSGAVVGRGRKLYMPKGG